MRRRTEARASSNERVAADNKDPSQGAQSQAEVKGRVSYSSVLLNIGKCLLLIIIIPPFLNYASLQREGQVLLPKDGQIVDVSLGQKMHLLCKGQGKPVVMLDAPTGMSSDVWFYVQESLATITKSVSDKDTGHGFVTLSLLNKDAVQTKARADSLPHVVYLKCDPNEVTQACWEGSIRKQPYHNNTYNNKQHLHFSRVCTYDRMGLGFSKRMMQNETTGTEKVWGMSTTGRMVDDLHRLVQAAGISKPFILVGSELGALNGRFFSHIHDAQVSDLVLIDPIPEDIFEEDQWKAYWFGQLLPSFQARQFSAATGLSRMLIILGFIQPTVTGNDVSEEVIQRQKYLLSNPAHQSSAVDEHYFMNESAAQVRDIAKFKPLSSRVSVSVITGDSFDEQIPENLNQMVAKLQKKFLEESYPSANQIHIKGADRRMIYKQPSAISQHLRRLVNQRQAKQQSE